MIIRQTGHINQFGYTSTYTLKKKNENSLNKFFFIPFDKTHLLNLSYFQSFNLRVQPS